jgi:hypothetical protein
MLFRIMLWRRDKARSNKTFPVSPSRASVRAFTLHSSQSLNCPSNLIGHDRPHKPANGEGRFSQWTGAALGVQGGQQ